MKKVSLRVRSFEKECFLTYNIDNEASLDEELLDFIEDEEPKGIVPVIFEEGDEFDTFSYNVTDKIHLSELSTQEVNAEMVLRVLRGLVLTLIDMAEYRIPLSYLVLHRDYIYVDSDYQIEFICIPLEDMQEEVDINSFLRGYLANIRYDLSENCEYVAKLLTYVNNTAMFNMRNLVTLVQELMDDMGIEIPEEDSAEIYVDYQEVIDNAEELDAADDEDVEEDDEIDETEATEEDEITEDGESEPEESEQEEETSDTEPDEEWEDAFPDEEAGQAEEVTEENDGLEESFGAAFEEEPDETVISGDADVQVEQDAEELSLKEEEPSLEDNLEEEPEFPEDDTEDGDEEDEAEEPETEESEEDSPVELEESKEKITKKPIFKTKEATVTGVVIEDELGEFLAEKEREDQLAQHEETGLKIKKNIKINRASIVKNTQEELKAEEEEAKAESLKEGETEEEEEEVVSTSILSQTLGGTGILKSSSVPKVNPYLIRTNTKERIMITKQNFKIGKASMGVDYTVKGNGAVSRTHAIITNKDGVYYIKDNKSTNHTYVNNKMVADGENELLTHDCKIVLGDEEFTFKLR